MRDLVLASQYANKGHNIIFATQNLEGNINHKILEVKYKLYTLKSNDIKELIKLIENLQIDILVINHYSIDYKYEKRLKSIKSTLKILSFDDTYEKHYCDILLNHNISADKKKYKGLVPKKCEVRCGSKYTLLREEFIKEKKKVKNNKEFNIQHSKLKVFIAMGGADSYNINIKILKLLNKISNIKINLVTTTANKNLKKLKNYCNDKKWINLYINSNDIAKLMRKNDLGIVTPSVIVNEIINLEIPFISIMVADNQLDMYNFLKKNKFYVLRINELNNLSKYIKKNINYEEEKIKIRQLLK